MIPKKIIKKNSITVGEFYEWHKTALKLKLVSKKIGFSRQIEEPAVNRPGLALCGFYDYFAYKRIQVFGMTELEYLKSLSTKEKTKRISEILEFPFPCVVISRSLDLEAQLMNMFEKKGIAVFQSSMVTMDFSNFLTFFLEWDFAPTVYEHGCMVDVQGIGILIRGHSGSGKSESVLGLLERGASLVADDLVVFKNYQGSELVGGAKEIGRFMMEVRGLGLINVKEIFGISSVRFDKKLDLVISLVPENNLNEIDRLGHEEKFYKILDIEITHIEIPVAPGRDLAKLIEVAALNTKNTNIHGNSSINFENRLIEFMQKNKIKQKVQSLM